MSTPATNYLAGIPASPEWKQELNERLAAARARRTREKVEQATLPVLNRFSGHPQTRASELAARVAARYAKAPSYSEMLTRTREAEEDEKARSASPARETARETAGSRNQSFRVDGGLSNPVSPEAEESSWANRSMSLFDAPAAASEQEIASEVFRPEASEMNREADIQATQAEEPQPAENEAESANEPPQPLPVNLIEFPRELVAVRRARPRLEEGPLREDANQAPAQEARAAAIEAEPERIQIAMEEAPAPSDWSPIHLDLQPATPQEEEPVAAAVDIHIHAAPIEDRAIASVVDWTLVLFAFVFFVFAAAASNASLPTGKSAVIAGGIVILGIYLLYQYLFFKFANGTPGMRYAKLALCTFEDEAPTRKQMRRRIPYLLFSAAPLGLGYLWAWFDANRLSWHDRLTRTYQRSYE